MSDEHDPRPAGSTDPESTPGNPGTDPATDPAAAAAEPVPASESIAAAAAAEPAPASESIAAAAAVTAPVAEPAAPPTIRRTRRVALAAAAGLTRLLRFAAVLALFVGGVALGYSAHQSTIVGSAAPVADPATAGNQPAPVIRELIAAVESNDADRIRSVVPSEPYKLFTSEMQNWAFQEVTSVETLATFEDGTRTATAFVMIGRSAQGNPVTINLVVETDGGNIVDFK